MLLSPWRGSVEGIGNYHSGVGHNLAPVKRRNFPNTPKKISEKIAPAGPLCRCTVARLGWNKSADVDIKGKVSGCKNRAARAAIQRTE
jgi:hypothetical protein